MTIGYIGLGHMGGALAKRLQVSRDLMVYDRDEESIRTLTHQGATAAAGVGEVAEKCEVIFVCLPTSEHVRSVIFDDGGISSAAAPGTVVIDQTTGDPNATRAMAADLQTLGIDLVDAPVSGGAKGAEAGTITIMVGAADKLFGRVHPFLSDISSNIYHAGGVGSGHVIKLVNNLMSGAQRLLSFEGMALATRNGVEAEVALQILRSGGGRNGYLEALMAAQVLSGKLNPGFTLALQHKDLRLACELAATSGVPTRFGELALNVYSECIEEMGASAQVDTAALVVDRLSGTHLVPRAHNEAS